MHSILREQNEPSMVKLLEASTVAYTRAKSWEIIITYVLIALAILYPITNVITENGDVKLGLFICSFMLTIIVQLFMSTFKGNTSKGAIYKEAFDVKLFGLRWKSTLTLPAPEEVERLAKHYTGAPIRDWYSPQLGEHLPRNIAIAVLQHSNTSWDIVLRHTYRRRLIQVLCIYSVILGIFLIVNRVSPLNTFLLLFSLLAFYTHVIGLIRAHSGIIQRRQAISTHLDELIQNKKEITMEELRDIQDEIHATRQESTKVPNFFFRLYQNKMNKAAEEYVAKVNELYKM